MAELLEELLARCRNGDGEAVAVPVRRFAPWAQDQAHAILGDWHLAEDASAIDARGGGHRRREGVESHQTKALGPAAGRPGRP